MKKVITFPSAFEETSVELVDVADSFLNGIKINDMNEKNYLVGNLAIQEGYSPHKFLNSSSKDIDYRVLFLSSLVLASRGYTFKFAVTTGFPYATYPAFRKDAIDYIKGGHQVTIDMSTFGGKGIKKILINVDHADVMTEIDGCVNTIRDGDKREKDNFFMASIGFGTFEAALSTPQGVINRTEISTRGINYATNILEKQLQKDYYLDLLTEQQIEMAFQRGVIVVDRKKIDITKQRSKALRTYYEEVISPAMKKKFTNDDFVSTEKMYLAGGGALYQDLVNMFKEEFGDIIDVQVCPEPLSCAGKGYCINSLKKFKPDSSEVDSIGFTGIDIGNSSTLVVTDLKEEGELLSNLTD
jgi:plasmid segregation protein ParM